MKPTTSSRRSKTLEWAYYQQHNLFDVSGASIGFGIPAGMHWAAPSFGGDPVQYVQILMSGCGAACSPVGATDQVSLGLEKRRFLDDRIFVLDRSRQDSAKLDAHHRNSRKPRAFWVFPPRHV